MYVITSFTQSNYLELAINDLEHNGIKKENIFATPLKQVLSQRKLFDSIDRSDGVGLFDGAAIMALILSVFGVIYGFEWKMGPIIWGLIGLVVGGSIGVIIDYLINKRKIKQKKLKKTVTEVFLMIKCDEGQVENIETILSKHFAIGIAKINQ